MEACGELIDVTMSCADGTVVEDVGAVLLSARGRSHGVFVDLHPTIERVRRRPG